MAFYFRLRCRVTQCEAHRLFQFFTQTFKLSIPCQFSSFCLLSITPDPRPLWGYLTSADPGAGFARLVPALPDGAAALLLGDERRRRVLAEQAVRTSRRVEQAEEALRLAHV